MEIENVVAMKSPAPPPPSVRQKTMRPGAHQIKGQMSSRRVGRSGALIAQMSSIRRRGSSTLSFTRTRKLTASFPSTMR